MAVTNRGPSLLRIVVRKLLDKYADLPMDFADATLVALGEELDTALVSPPTARISRSTV